MEQPRQKPMVSAILAPLFLGIIGFATLAGRARFSGYHTVDVLQLLASGMCFGVALAGLLRGWRSRGEPEA